MKLLLYFYSKYLEFDVEMHNLLTIIINIAYSFIINVEKSVVNLISYVIP